MKIGRKGRFSANLYSNLLGFALTMLINLWYVPFLIRYLGIATYGLIALATQLQSYLSVFTMVLNSAVSRYMIIALEQEDHAGANRYFNTAFFSGMVLIALLALPVAWAVFHINRFINVPPGTERDFFILISCAAGTMAITTLSSPFGVATYCRNRFDVRSAINVGQRLATVCLVAILFKLFTPRLAYVGVALLIGTAIALVGNAESWRRLTPSLRIKPASFNLSALRELTGTGGWMTMNNVGAILFLYVDLLVVNKLLGAEAGGKYAAALQWSALLRTVAALIAGVFGPTVIMLYAKGDPNALATYVRQAMKLMGLMVALPVGLICGLAPALLETWLGPGFVELAGLMTLMTIHLSVNLTVLPLFNVQIAANRVRFLGLATLIGGACNLLLALLLAGPLGLGMYGVALAGLVTLTAKDTLLTSLHVSHILGTARATFLRVIIPVFSATILLTAVARGITLLAHVTGWPRLACVASLLSIGYCALAYLLLLTPEERKLLQRKLSWKSFRLQSVSGAAQEVPE
jgi:membrane protein EpsK